MSSQTPFTTISTTFDKTSLDLFLLGRLAPRRPLPLVFRPCTPLQPAENTSVMLCDLLSPIRHFVHRFWDSRLPPGNWCFVVTPRSAVGCPTCSSFVAYRSVDSPSKPSTGQLGQCLPSKRPPFRHRQRPPQQRRKPQPFRPLQLQSLRPDDQSSHRPPVLEPQQHLVPAQHLRPEPHPVLVSPRLPALVPQRLLYLRP